MNNLTTNDGVAAQAHADAQDLLSGGVDPNDGATVTYMANALASELQLAGLLRTIYIERFVGHCVNVACSGKGS